MFRYVFLSICLFAFPAQALVVSSSAGALKLVTVAQGLEHPWGMAFLPDGRILVTERPGRLRLVSAKGVLSEPLAGVPAVFAEGQGGLLDVALDPAFSSNKTLYLAYAEAEGDVAGTAVARAVLEGAGLAQLRVIFRQRPKVKGVNHWGARLAFAPDGNLFITLGERFDYRDKAQDLSSHLGKVVRIRSDGSVPEGNPFAGKAGALPEIWTLGHRNMQGAAVHPQTGALWTAEHGPRGGDEINVEAPGRNYGWPEASYGAHYSGIPIPDSHAPRFVEPVYHWTPSISPSGLMFYSGQAFPGWQGDLFTGGLSGMMLIRLDMENGKPVKEERLLEDLQERIRDVRQGNDGYIYLLTDSDEGKLLRLEPAS